MAGLAREPFVFVREEHDEFGVGEFGNVADFRRGGLAVSDFVNAAAGAVNAVVLVAFTNVRPVEHEDAAVGAVAEIDAAEPRVGGREKIRRVFADVAAAAAFEAVHVGAEAVEIQREEGAAIRVGPVVALINHEAAVGVAAAGLGRGARHAFRADVAPLLGGVPVEMIGVLFEKTVGVRVERLAEHAPIVRAGDQVPEMADDGVDDKGLAVLVPIHAPRVGRAVGDDFKNFSHGMIAPDAAVHFRALGFGRAGFANRGSARDSVSAVEPAIRSPFQAVGEIVADVFALETVEHDDGIAVGHVVTVAVREKKKIRRTQRPDAAEADFEARENLRAVPEHGAFVEASVAVGVLENHDAIPQRAVEADLGFGVGVVLGDPETAARIEGHGDGILHVGFGGEERRLETGREFQHFQRVLRRRERLVVGGLGVEDFWERRQRRGGGVCVRNCGAERVDREQ